MALPLEAINAASAREKSIRHGHPSTLHLWWARRPLAACRAVLFASIVDDPSSRPEEFPTEEAQEAERQRLFKIIERLVLWKSTNNEEVLNEARAEILKATDGHPPPVLDPFCGGGSIPLEAQRLGLEAHASDLNPVAVLITKALIEIPPEFAGMPPVNPEARKKMQMTLKGAKEWKGAEGLAEDVRYYGKWMRDEAEKRIGHLYPKAKLPDGTEATVIAWLWARTVKCPNPACGAMMPLLTSFVLSSKKGKEAYLVPKFEGKKLSFDIASQPPDVEDIKKGMKRGMSGIFKCIFCGTTTTRDYVAAEGKNKLIGVLPTAIVAEGSKGRIYLPANDSILPEIKILPEIDKAGLEAELSPNPRDVWCRNFGLNTPVDLFTPRQLVALTTFSDLVAEARRCALSDALAAGMPEGKGIAEGGRDARAYADAVATYLAMAFDRLADRSSTISSWDATRDSIRNTFARQAIPMVWDYAEANPFSNSSGNFLGAVGWIVDVLRMLSPKVNGRAGQYDSTMLIPHNLSPLISTDPPYYDNIGYADLSDFFYVWLRRSLAQVHPDIFSTLLVPKERELVAIAYRFNGSKKEAGRFFEEGLGRTFNLTRKVCRWDFPLTIYYAFKQAEEDAADSGLASTGWEVMLESLITSGYVITGTWPMRTELSNRSGSLGTNALASSIILVCRPRPDDAPIGTRKEFISALKRELPLALHQLQKSNIAPVDLAQAAIGPGMAIFSRYSQVLEADGSPMRVRTALQLINQHLDEYLSEQEGEYDPDTRWALSWFEQYGMNEGPFGDAETLSKAKNTSVEGMVQAGILKAGAGKARLLGRNELDPDWNPATDRRLTIWEATEHLIRVLESQGEEEAAMLQSSLGGYAESARDLAYRLHSICERRGWAQEAVSYNSLVTVWPRLKELSVKRERPMDRKLTDKGTFE